MGQTGPQRVVSTPVLAHEQGNVRLPRFAPDSRSLAYAVDVRKEGLPLSEVRTIHLANGVRRTLLGWREAQGAAVYSGHAFSLDWQDSDYLEAIILDGDVGHTKFRLDRRRSASISQAYVESDEPVEVAPADPAIAAIVPHAKSPALDAAVANALVLEGKGLVLQKSYVGEDRHVWWVNTLAGEARIVIPEVDGEKSELRGGFAFADRLLFALRQGGAVRIYRLDADGSVARVPGAGAETIPGSARFANAYHTQVGALEIRRCAPEACWARLTMRGDDWTHVQVLRMDRKGGVEVVAGLDGLDDFDLSPDGRWLAATIRNGEHAKLILYRVLER